MAPLIGRIPLRARTRRGAHGNVWPARRCQPIRGDLGIAKRKKKPFGTGRSGTEGRVIVAGRFSLRGTS